MDREMRYAKHWLASMGIYNYEEPHDPWWSELHNFLLSVRDGKPIVAPFAIGVSDAQGVIYGNRSMETGQSVYWPGSRAQERSCQGRPGGLRAVYRSQVTGNRWLRSRSGVRLKERSKV